MIIEAVTGRAYTDELTSRITPLGLTNTFVPSGTKAPPPGHVRGYVGRIFYLDVTQMFEPSLGGSSGGVATSGADATKFMQALVTGSLVSPERLTEMLTPYSGPNARSPTTAWASLATPSHAAAKRGATTASGPATSRTSRPRVTDVSPSSPSTSLTRRRCPTKVYGHNGAMAGYLTFAFAVPDGPQGVVLTSATPASNERLKLATDALTATLCP
jgi:hypothetical protein